MAYGSAVDDLIKPSSSHCSFQHQSSFNAELARLTFHGYIIKRPIACSPALRNSDLLTSSPLPSAKIISIKTAVFSLLASATIVAAQAKCADNYQAKTDDVQACADQLRDKGTEECAIVGDVGNNVCQIGEAKIQITSPDYTVVDESSYCRDVGSAVQAIIDSCSSGGTTSGKTAVTGNGNILVVAGADNP